MRGAWETGSRSAEKWYPQKSKHLLLFPKGSDMYPEWYSMLNPAYYGFTDPVLCEVIRIFMHILISYAIVYLLIKKNFNQYFAVTIGLTIGLYKEILDFHYIQFFSFTDLICDAFGCFMALIKYKLSYGKYVSPEKIPSRTYETNN